MDKRDFERELDKLEEKISKIEFGLEGMRGHLNYIEDVCASMRSTLLDLKEEICREIKENVDITS